MRLEPTWPVLRGLIQRWTGVCLADRNAYASLRSLGEVAARASVSPAAYLNRVTEPAEAEARDQLIDAVTIGTSWWMRERDGLDTAVMSATRHARQTGIGVVRVWSAGCSTGQEPYSVAMLLLEAGLTPSVFATDVNRGFLRHAARGRYTRVQLRGLPDALRERYFREERDGSWRVSNPLRQMVSFAHHNLVTDPAPRSGRHRFDVVLCRNVLIYFESDQALAISRALSKARRPGGALVLGAVERPLVDMLDRADNGAVPSLPPLRRMRPVHRPVPPRPPRKPANDPIADAFVALDRAGGDGLDAAALARDHALSPSAHLLRGLACKRAGDLAGACDAFRRACFLDHASWLAPYQLGLCLEEIGHGHDAVRAYRDAMRVLAEGGPSGVPGPSAAEHDAAARTVSDSCWQRIRALSQGDTR